MVLKQVTQVEGDNCAVLTGLQNPALQLPIGIAASRHPSAQDVPASCLGLDLLRAKVLPSQTHLTLTTAGPTAGVIETCLSHC